MISYLQLFSLGAISFLLGGCSGYVYVTPPAAHVNVSQVLPPLQQVGPELDRPKPKHRSIIVKQTAPGLTQKVSGYVKAKADNIFAKQNLPRLGQKSTGAARQPGSFGDEYSPEYQ